MAWPVDQDATERIDEWLSKLNSHTDPKAPLPMLQAISADLRGAVMPGAPLVEPWLTEAQLDGIDLRGADLDDAHLEGACLDEADLRGARPIEAAMDHASLNNTRLDGAVLSGASMYCADARKASLRGCDLRNCSMIHTDLRGADLSGALAGDERLSATAFDVRLDERTVVRGFSGVLIGECILDGDGGERKLADAELQGWLNARGAFVEILPRESRSASRNRRDEIHGG